MTATTHPPDPADLRASLDRDGFVLIPHAISNSELTLFRHAAQTATAAARAGKWPYIRTLPKQFPPWPSNPSPGIWGVQHLLHPDMPASSRAAFAQSYFHPVMIRTITGLLDCAPSSLVLELYNMLIRPDTDFSLRWHRDDIPPETAPEEEERRLAERMLHAQWNLALYPDSSLIVVPGSHRRARTDMERSADPYEDDMPGQKVVRMDAGDVLFYNNNILHRGVYDSRGPERMTLHGTMGVVGRDRDRARNILQHGIGEWAGRARFGDEELGLDAEMREVAVGMQRRLMKMGREEGEVGFSQRD